MIAAAAFHECCHYIMLKFMGVSVFGITIGVDGAVIDTGPMTSHQELVCSLAGPAGSFLLLLAARWFPMLSLCAGIQGLYNLIPVMPFDGGRALRCILEICCPQVSDSVMKAVRIAICCLIPAVGILGMQYGILSVLVSFVLLRKMLPRKRPCKEGLKRVQ